MIDWSNRTMIVAAAQAPLARSICETLAPVGGSGMFATALSATGAEPASHFISAGMIETAFADLLPLTTRVVAEDGAATESKAPGNPQAVVYLATQAGMTLTLAEVQALFDACDVTVIEPLARIAQRGLKTIQPPL